MSSTAAFHQREATLFLGAGISRSCCPMAKDITRLVLDGLLERAEDRGVCEAFESYGREKVTARVSLENLLQVVLDSLPAERHHCVYDLYRQCTGRSDLAPNSHHQAVAALCREGRISRVLTTNQDILLEKALAAAYGVSPEAFTVYDEKSWQSADRHIPLVIHLHGVAGLAPEQETLTVTLRDVGMEITEGWRYESAVEAAADKSVLVSGYSGNDYDIAILLAELRRTHGATFDWYCYGTPSGRLRALVETIDVSQDRLKEENWQTFAQVLKARFACSCPEPEWQTVDWSGGDWSSSIERHDALMALAWVCFTAEAHRAAELCLRRDKGGDTDARCAMLLALGYVLREQGKHIDAQHALAKAERLATDEDRARAMLKIGESRAALERMPLWTVIGPGLGPAGMREIEKARLVLEGSRERFRSGPGWALMYKALAWRRLGMLPDRLRRLKFGDPDYANDRAAALFRQAIERFRGEGETRGEGRALTDLRYLGSEFADELQQQRGLELTPWAEDWGSQGNEAMRIGREAEKRRQYWCAVTWYERARHAYSQAEMPYEESRNALTAAVCRWRATGDGADRRDAFSAMRTALSLRGTAAYKMYIMKVGLGALRR